MTTFDDREKAFESKFAHDAELQFKVGARTAKLLGLWAAQQMGLSGDAAAAYAKETVVADLAEAGQEDLIRKIMTDFKAKGVAVTEAALRAQLGVATAEAKKQIQTEG